MFRVLDRVWQVSPWGSNPVCPHFCKYIFIETQPHPIFYTLSMLQGQSWIISTETEWHTRLKIFTTRPFTEKSLPSPGLGDHSGGHGKFYWVIDRSLYPLLPQVWICPRCAGLWHGQLGPLGGLVEIQTLPTPDTKLELKLVFSQDAQVVLPLLSTCWEAWGWMIIPRGLLGVFRYGTSPLDFNHFVFILQMSLLDAINFYVSVLQNQSIYGQIR